MVMFYFDEKSTLVSAVLKIGIRDLEFVTRWKRLLGRFYIGICRFYKYYTTIGSKSLCKILGVFFGDLLVTSDLSSTRARNDPTCREGDLGSA